MKISSIIFSSLLCCCSVSALAMEMSHPFYLPAKKVVVSEIKGDFYRKQVKQAHQHTDYEKTLAMALSYGLSDKASLNVEVGNMWERKTKPNASTHHQARNVFYRIGGSYDFYQTDAILTKVNVDYFQQETHHKGGAYKALQVEGRVGYRNDFILPYLGAEVELPIAQSKKSDDKLKYDAYLGLYRKLGAYLAADAKVNFNYDDNDKAREWRADASLSVLPTDKIALTLFGQYVLDDKGKENTESFEKRIGVSVKFAF